MIQRQVKQSCCGKSTVLFLVEKPARLTHVNLFKESGFTVPDNYIKAGMLYAKKEGLIVSCTFGICTVNVRCTGPNCDSLVNEAEAIFKKIESLS